MGRIIHADGPSSTLGLHPPFFAGQVCQEKYQIYTPLVGGFDHLEKYEFVNFVRIIPYMKWKMF